MAIQRKLALQAIGNLMNSTCRIEQSATTITLTLTRAHCLDIAGKTELAAAVAEIGKMDSARALILASDHPQAMLVDVGELVDMSSAQALAFSQGGHRLADALAALPIPVIAAVDGLALGGGCELILSCDLTIAGSAAQFGQIEASGGVIPGFGGSWRLARRVGFQRACEMIFTAAVVDAPTAVAYGLALEDVPNGALLDRCAELAHRIAQLSRASVTEAKRVLVGGWGMPPNAASALEQSAFSSLFGSEDQRRRMTAFSTEQAKR